MQRVQSPAAMPPSRNTVYLARCLYQVTTAVAAEALGDDITLLQWAVLVHIGVNPDIDQSGLSERAGIDRTNTGRIIEELVTAGLANRRVDDLDRRSRLLRLTARGRDVLKRLRPLAFALEDRLLAPLTAKEKETFFDLVGRMIQANRAYLRPGAGRRKLRRKSRAKKQ
jgi:DNA-binding MarR family transcriptional regulator